MADIPTVKTVVIDLSKLPEAMKHVNECPPGTDTITWLARYCANDYTLVLDNETRQQFKQWTFGARYEMGTSSLIEKLKRSNKCRTQ